MGKRSSFERREGDRWATPREAVEPLLPHLTGIKTFAEPCCGDGDLVRHLEDAGLRCPWSSDISGGQDALDIDDFGPVDAIITNPPYTRKVMLRSSKNQLSTGKISCWTLLFSRFLDFGPNFQTLPTIFAHCSPLPSH